MTKRLIPAPGEPPGLSRADLAIAAALFGLAIGYFSLSIRLSLDLRDEGLIYHHSARVASGEVPYEDFPDTYGPGVFAVTGLVLRAFDGQILPVRWLLAALKALAVVLTFVIARPLAGRSFAIFGALCSLALWGRPSWNLNTPYAALYSIPLCLLACFALIRAFRVDSRRAYFVAGVIGGSVFLFKQTLGAVNTLGMLLAVSAVTALAGEGGRSVAGALQFLAVWLPGALAIVLPAMPTLRLMDYVLHFLPLHAAMGTVAASVVVRGGCAPLTPAIGRRLAPLVAGIAVPVGVEIVFFAARGALGALLFNAVTLPATIVNYYYPFPVPPVGRCLVVLAVVALVFAGLLVLRGQWRRAGFAGLCASAALFGAAALVPTEELNNAVTGPYERTAFDSNWRWVLPSLPGSIESTEPALVMLGATAMLAPTLLLKSRAVPPSFLRVVLPLVLLQATLIYQVFPRGAHNLWMIQGALMPLATIVLAAWYGFGARSTTFATRKAAAAAMVAVLPVWLCAPAASQLMGSLAAPRVRELAIPRARGITLDETDAQLINAFDIERLVAFLRASEPGDAPVLPITPDLTVLYLSGRRHVFPDVDYYLFLVGLDMLPEAQHRELVSAPLDCRLADQPDTLVIFNPNDAGARIVRAVPSVLNAIVQDHETVAEFGPYAVLRRKASAQYPSSCATRSR